VRDFHYFVWKSDGEGNFVGVNHDKGERKMRQERQPQYLETGAIYVMKTEGFRKHRHRFFGKTAKYVMPSENVLEIDDAVDFTIASALLEQRLKKQRQQSLPENIDVVVFDFDGVFTDDLVHVLEDGTEAVTCSRSDGMGVKLAKQAGVPLLILSSEKNSVVKRRADKLNINVISGVDDKATVLDAWLKKNKFCWKNTVFVGNDVNDTDCLKKSGCGVAVANASRPARKASNLILQNCGGNHAVRELIDLILTTSKYK
jgi:N-acylneuraminate cytidylyltransferase